MVPASYMLVPIFVVVVVALSLYSVKRGKPTPSPVKSLFILIAFAIVVTLIYASRGLPLEASIGAALKLVSSAILLIGAVFIVCASIGLFRFGDEWGVNIFYVRNHITGIIDDTCALVMIFVGLLIGRVDVAAVGLIFFALIPFIGNALANAYYYTKQRGERP